MRTNTKLSSLRNMKKYQDHLTKFVAIRPLTSKRAAKVAHQLLDIFSWWWSTNYEPSSDKGSSCSKTWEHSGWEKWSQFIADRTSRKDGKDNEGPTTTWTSWRHCCYPNLTCGQRPRDPRNLLGIILSHDDNELYTICVHSGILKGIFSRNQFDVCKQAILKESDVNQTCTTTLRAAVSEESASGGRVMWNATVLGPKRVKQTDASATKINWSVPVIATVNLLVKISSHYYTYKMSA